MQLVFSAILDAGIYPQSVYSLSTYHSRIRFFNVHFTALLHGQMVYFLLATATVHRKRKLYIYLTPIAGGFRILYTDSENIETGYPTPIYIPLSEARGGGHLMVGRRILSSRWL